MSHSGQSLMLRPLVRVYGWALYSDHYGLSLLMLKRMVWRGDTMRERYRLFQEKLSLGSSHNCFESINAFSTNSDNEAAETLLIAGTEHNIPYCKVYKQIVSDACFHFLTVVTGLDFARRNQLLIASVARCR